MTQLTSDGCGFDATEEGQHMHSDNLVHLCHEDVSLLLDIPAQRPPAIAYWGKSLTDLPESDAYNLVRATVAPIGGNAPDEPIRPAIIAQHCDGWAGAPSIMGCRPDGSDFSTSMAVIAVRVDGQEVSGYQQVSGPCQVQIEMADASADLGLVLTIEMLTSGLLRMRAKLHNTGSDVFTLQRLTLTAPVPLAASETLDFAGRWGLERTAQRQDITVGTHLRENRRGRTGADSAYVLHAGTPGFNFSSGQVWAMHVAWSGNHVHYLERTYHGDQVLGGGELLLAGEGRLEPDATYQSPWVYLSYGEGLDQVASRFHRYMRSRPTHPKRPRPVTLNVWEAVYFNHDLPKLKALADAAAEIGIERFVLDDGWFGSRRNDLSGLGDWVISADVWPDGLTPLIEYVNSKGMEFGLWFEPEMVNEDSDVARAHPDWIMQTGSRLPVRSRYQQVLNLSIPQAYEHVRDQMVEVLQHNNIAYIKWDHNRDLIDAGTSPTGDAAVHAQTLATYRLMDELKERFPGLEIESCSSGGGRVDLEVLQRTERIWVSDCIDPLERQSMNRWTSQLVPLEMMGTHIASGASHTTGRYHCLNFRAASALFGHLGIEWDLTQASPQEIEQLKEWIAFYKDHRELITSGTVVRGDRTDDSLWITGVVSPSRDQAIYTLTCMKRAEFSPRGRFTLPGLDSEVEYHVEITPIGGFPSGFKAPAWSHAEPLERGVSASTPAPYFGQNTPPTKMAPIKLRGDVLTNAGVMSPLLNPEQSIVIKVRAAS